MRNTSRLKLALRPTIKMTAVGLVLSLLAGCPNIQSKQSSIHRVIEKNPYLKQAISTQLKEHSDDYRELFAQTSENELTALDLGTIDDFEAADIKWIFSPDRRTAIAINATTQSPDHSLDIYNRQANEHVERLDFCGTPCTYIGAYWLDNQHFAFVQLIENYSDDSGKQDGYVLVVSEYDLSNEVIINYQSSQIREQASGWRKQATN